MLIYYLQKKILPAIELNLEKKNLILSTLIKFLKTFNLRKFFNCLPLPFRKQAYFKQVYTEMHTYIQYTVLCKPTWSLRSTVLS